MALTIKSSHIGQDVQALSMGRDEANFSIAIGATENSRDNNSPVVGLTSDVGYHINIGGIATSDDWFVPGNVMWFAVVDNLSVSCLSATGGTGTLYISEAV